MHEYDGEGVEARAKKIKRQQRLYVSLQYHGDQRTEHTSYEEKNAVGNRNRKLVNNQKARKKTKEKPPHNLI